MGRESEGGCRRIQCILNQQLATAQYLWGDRVYIVTLMSRQQRASILLENSGGCSYCQSCLFLAVARSQRVRRVPLPPCDPSPFGKGVKLPRPAGPVWTTDDIDVCYKNCKRCNKGTNSPRNNCGECVAHCNTCTLKHAVEREEGGCRLDLKSKVRDYDLEKRLPKVIASHIRRSELSMQDACWKESKIRLLSVITTENSHVFGLSGTRRSIAEANSPSLGYGCRAVANV